MALLRCFGSRISHSLTLVEYGTSDSAPTQATQRHEAVIMDKFDMMNKALEGNAIKLTAIKVSQGPALPLTAALADGICRVNSTLNFRTPWIK